MSIDYKVRLIGNSKVVRVWNYGEWINESQVQRPDYLHALSHPQNRTCQPLTLRVTPDSFDAFEKLDIIDPNLMGLDVHAHLVQREVVSLRHLLAIRRQGPFGLLHVIQIAFPQVDIQDFDETTLKEFLHLFVLMISHLALDIQTPKTTGRREL